MATIAIVHGPRVVGEKYTRHIVKVTPGTYATGGEPLDLTGIFKERCWGGNVISVPTAAKAGIRFSISSQGGEGTKITSTNVKLVAIRDPALGTTTQGDLVEVTNGVDLSTYILHIEFVGY